MKNNDNPRVEGWKNISAYVNLSERHLRRLVNDGKFPIQRKGEGSRSPVFALQKDLDTFNTTYWKKEIVKKHSPYRIYMIPFILFCIWTGLVLIPRYEEEPYYKHYEITQDTERSSDLLLFDQYGNRTTALDIARPYPQDFKTGVIWCPNLEETPVFLEILTTTNPNEIRIHRLGGSSRVWNPPIPWIVEGANTISKIIRMNTHAFDGILLVRNSKTETGFILQLFNRKKELIAELASDKNMQDLIWDRRFLTLCMEDGSEQKVNLWQWINHSGLILE